MPSRAPATTLDGVGSPGLRRLDPLAEESISAALRKALRNRAIRLLARRDYSRAVLHERLLSLGPSLLGEASKAGQTDDRKQGSGAAARGPIDDDHAVLDPARFTALVTDVLDRLQAEGLQSDQRVADTLVRRSAARHGNLRLAQRLAREGLARELVDEAVASRADSDWQRAWHLWQARFGEPATEPREKARQARFLASRGFSADIVARVLAGRAPP